jgi:hypothetical protein
MYHIHQNEILSLGVVLLPWKLEIVLFRLLEHSINRVVSTFHRAEAYFNEAFAFLLLIIITSFSSRGVSCDADGASEGSLDIQSVCLTFEGLLLFAWDRGRRKGSGVKIGSSRRHNQSHILLLRRNHLDHTAIFSFLFKLLISLCLCFEH